MAAELQEDVAHQVVVLRTDPKAILKFSEQFLVAFQQLIQLSRDELAQAPGRHHGLQRRQERGQNDVEILHVLGFRGGNLVDHHVTLS